MKKTFLSGLALLLPIALTFLIGVFILNFLTKPFVHYVEQVVINTGSSVSNYISPRTLHYLVQFVILILLFFFTVLVGALGRLFIINYFLKMGESIIHRLPFINTIYKTTKDILRSLFSPDQNSFKQVVIVPFPTANKYCLGLLSGSSPEACQKEVGKELVTVLLPTAPHPISGYLILFKKEDVIITNMSIEDAVKFTVSCGIVHPAS